MIIMAKIWRRMKNHGWSFNLSVTNRNDNGDRINNDKWTKLEALDKDSKEQLPWKDMSHKSAQRNCRRIPLRGEFYMWSRLANNKPSNFHDPVKGALLTEYFYGANVFPVTREGSSFLPEVKKITHNFKIRLNLMFACWRRGWRSKKSDTM